METPTRITPANRALVAALFICAQSGGPMERVDRIDVTAGSGIVGDRYFGSRHRHITVQSCTELEAASEVLGQPIDPAATRRNVTLSHGAVPVIPGAQFMLGELHLEVVRQAAPCRVMETAVAPGARAALRRRGGAVCRVLVGGELRCGDAFEAVAIAAG